MIEEGSRFVKEPAESTSRKIYRAGIKIGGVGKKTSYEMASAAKMKAVVIASLFLSLNACRQVTKRHTEANPITTVRRVGPHEYLLDPGSRITLTCPSLDPKSGDQPAFLTDGRHAWCPGDDITHWQVK